MFPIMGDALSGEEKPFLSEKKVFPSLHPFSKKAEYFAAPLSRRDLIQWQHCYWKNIIFPEWEQSVSINFYAAFAMFF